uniref:AlNc14C25G2499 protein n=1 Tax=Albugo laibachii Nc14 TaxID=890382 RepID=F0W6L0_9STRA|nr:AlNc14C25G2499 [Albugo laibachii Nc14]|eukprot:CCA16755.1 AlNc14C25G2499 [Albugo laibachii Nc14]
MHNFSSRKTCLKTEIWAENENEKAQRTALFVFIVSLWHFPHCVIVPNQYKPIFGDGSKLSSLNSSIHSISPNPLTVSKLRLTALSTHQYLIIYRKDANLYSDMNQVCFSFIISLTFVKKKQASI